MKLSKLSQEELITYVQGEGELSLETLNELMTLAETSPRVVYRGLSFDSREDFEVKYGEDIFVKYLAKAGESFSLSKESAESFAQDIYSNFGVVLEINLENAYLNLSTLPLEIKEQIEDFSHEQELILLEESVVSAKIIKSFKDTNKKLGLK